MGHFEFGLDRRPINTGDQTRTEQIIELWDSNDSVRGWARYWSDLYSHVADRLDENSNLAAASLIIRYEDLCQSSDETINRTVSHCALKTDPSVIAEFSARLTLPEYYRPSFSDEELTIIAEETRTAASRFGY